MRLPDPFADRYTNLRFVGRGGFGVVYRAWDPQMERDVALKFLNPELAADDDWRKRFRQEATAASKFTHSNITIFYDRGEYQGQPFIVMQFVEGEPLSRIIEQRLPLSDPERLFLIEQLCDGLHYAHQRHIIHRDIKPVNLIVQESQDGSQVVRALKILDFGIAKTVSAGQTSTGQMMFTPNYVSPEQVRGDEVDRRGDMFSVGCVAYELLTFEKAFTITSTNPFSVLDEVRKKIAEQPHRPMTSVRADIDPELSAVIDRALAKFPDDRFRDLAEMRRKLQRIRERLEEAEPQTSQTTIILSRSQQAAVKRAREAIEAGDPTAAIVSLREALASASNQVVRRFIEQELEEAQEKQAAKLAEKRARDEQAARDVIASATAAFERGDETVAIRLLEQFAPSELVDERRSELTRAAALIRRVERAIAQGSSDERAAALLELGEFSPADLIRATAGRLRARAEAIEKATQERAQAAVLSARAAFAKGDRSGALESLERFDEPARVLRAIEQLGEANRAVEAASNAVRTGERKQRAKAIERLERFDDRELVAAAIAELRSIDQQRRETEDHDRAAATLIEAALKQFEKDRSLAIARLEGFAPSHTSVTAALAELRERARQLDEQEARERQAAQEREAALQRQRARERQEALDRKAAEERQAALEQSAAKAIAQATKLFASGARTEAIEDLRRFGHPELTGDPLREMEQLAALIKRSEERVRTGTPAERRAAIEKLAPIVPEQLTKIPLEALRELDAELTAAESRHEEERARAALVEEARTLETRAHDLFVQGAVDDALGLLTAFRAPDLVAATRSNLQSAAREIQDARAAIAREPAFIRRATIERLERRTPRELFERAVAQLRQIDLERSAEEERTEAERLTALAERAVMDAQRQFERGDHDAAIKALQAFTPVQPAVTRALEELKQAYARILEARRAKEEEDRKRRAAEEAARRERDEKERQRREAEHAAKVRDVAAAVAQADSAIAEERFDAAAALLDRAAKMLPDSRDVATSRTRLAQAVAAVDAREKARRISEIVRNIDLQIQSGQFAAATDLLSAAAAQRVADKDLAPLRERLEAAQSEYAEVAAALTVLTQAVEAAGATDDAVLRLKHLDEALAAPLERQPPRGAALALWRREYQETLRRARDLRTAAATAVAERAIENALEKGSLQAAERALRDAEGTLPEQRLTFYHSLVEVFRQEQEAEEAARRAKEEADRERRAAEDAAHRAREEEERQRLEAERAEKVREAAALVTQANTATAEGRFEEASGLLNRASQLQPDSPEIASARTRLAGASEAAEARRKRQRVGELLREIGAEIHSGAFPAATALLSEAAALGADEALLAPLRDRLATSQTELAQVSSGLAALTQALSDANASDNAARRVEVLDRALSAALDQRPASTQAVAKWWDYQRALQQARDLRRTAAIEQAQGLIAHALSQRSVRKAESVLQQAEAAFAGDPVWIPLRQQLEALRAARAAEPSFGDVALQRIRQVPTSVAAGIVVLLLLATVLVIWRPWVRTGLPLPPPSTGGGEKPAVPLWESQFKEASSRLAAGQKADALKIALESLKANPKYDPTLQLLTGLRTDAAGAATTARDKAVSAGAGSRSGFKAAEQKTSDAQAITDPLRTDEAIRSFERAAELYRSSETERFSAEEFLEAAQKERAAGRTDTAVKYAIDGLEQYPRNDPLVSFLRSIRTEAMKLMAVAQQAATKAGATAANSKTMGSADEKRRFALARGAPEQTAEVLLALRDAERLYRDAAKETPIDTVATTANDQIGRGDLVGASRTLVKGLGGAPRNSDLLALLRGVVSRAENDADAARRAANTANASGRSQFATAFSRVTSAVDKRRSTEPEDLASAVTDYADAARLYREAAALGPVPAPPPPPVPIAETVSKTRDLIRTRNYSDAAGTVLAVLGKAPQNPELLGVLREVLEAAENAAIADRKTADSVNASSRPEYANATSRFQSAAKARASGSPEDAESAVRDYTAAAGLYREAARASTPVPPPLPIGGGEKPPATPNDETLIAQTLQRYSAAMSARNPDAVLEVYPSADRRELQKTFGMFKTYNMQVRPTSPIQVTANVATVRCRMQLQTQGGQMGNLSEEVTILFRLTKTADRWVVASMTRTR